MLAPVIDRPVQVTAPASTIAERLVPYYGRQFADSLAGLSHMEQTTRVIEESLRLLAQQEARVVTIDVKTGLVHSIR